MVVNVIKENGYVAGLRLDAVDVAAWRVPGGGGVYKISYNIIISYRISSD